MADVEPRAVAEKVRFIFGDVAEKILKIEEQRLGISPERPLTEEDLKRLANDLKELSQRMAGNEISSRVYDEVLQLARGQSSGSAPGTKSGPSRRSP